MKFTSLIKLTVAEEPRVALNEKLWFVLEIFWGIDGKRRFRSGSEKWKNIFMCESTTEAKRKQKE